MPRVSEKSTVLPVSPGPTTSVAGKSIPIVAEGAYLSVLWGKNVGAATFYLHIVDALALPADGPVVHKVTPLEVAAGFEFVIEVPLAFTKGICIYASSTQINKTLILGNDLIATMQYSDRM